MLNKQVIDQIPQITLVTFDQFKAHKIKRNFVFENDAFFTTVAKSSKTAENIREGSDVEVSFGTQKIVCKAELISDFQKTVDYLKKEMARLTEFYGNKYERGEAHLRVSATNQLLVRLKTS